MQLAAVGAAEDGFCQEFVFRYANNRLVFFERVSLRENEAPRSVTRFAMERSSRLGVFHLEHHDNETSDGAGTEYD